MTAGASTRSGSTRCWSASSAPGSCCSISMATISTRADAASGRGRSLSGAWARLMRSSISRPFSSAIGHRRPGSSCGASAAASVILLDADTLRASWLAGRAGARRRAPSCACPPSFSDPAARIARRAGTDQRVRAAAPRSPAGRCTMPGMGSTQTAARFSSPIEEQRGAATSTAVYAIGPGIEGDELRPTWSRRKAGSSMTSFVFEERGKSTLRFHPRAGRRT